MRLRRIVTGDLKGLAEIHALSFGRSWPADELWDLAARPGAVALAALDDEGEPQGFILCWRVAEEAEILTVAVRPDARRSGLGKRLVQAGGELAASEGAEVLWLEVACDNAAALALYRSLGFEEAGRRPGYYRREPPQPNIDALVLRRRLTVPAQPLILG